MKQARGMTVFVARSPDWLISCPTLGSKWDHIEQTDMLAWQFV